jgi:DNA gyrase subunit A
MSEQSKLFSQKIGVITQTPLVDEVKQAYLEYAMSVIVSRALPDVRDGLKPVHRRILYAMWSMGLRHNARYRKCAHVVGEVMAKYHPHGDSAIYDSLVRMAQDFSMLHTLVDGQGNFGSMDGDSAAAYRYTEARLDWIAEELLHDIEKETVPFVANYDGSHHEPSVLPTKVPNLLLNGTVGIAVGMATSIPPHNLGELCDAVMMLINKPETTIEEIAEVVKGPDFPTGAVVYGKKDIFTAFATGRGGVVMRAKADIKETKTGQFQIIISEVPYQVNKATLIEKIADLVQEKKLEGIKDLRDESNKDGVRVVIELKKDAYPKKILNQLYNVTELQTTFHYNMLALVDGIQPRVLSIKTILEEFIKHRQVVIRKRTEFDLEKNKDRAHILEGLKKALDQIDAVIKTIRAANDKDAAKTDLMKKFGFTDRQATAILEMRLQQLANLERQKIEDELKEKLAIIKELESILASEKKILEIVKTETEEIKTRFAHERRTQIIAHGVKDFTVEDLIPNEPTIIITTTDGYIKRVPPETFRQQSRGGKGVIGVTTKEEESVECLRSTNTHDNILFFTNRGRVFQLPAYEIPPGSRTAKGQALVNFLQLAPNEKISAMLAMADMTTAKYLVMATRQGLIKKTALHDFTNVRRSGIIALKLKLDDSMEWVRPSSGKDNVMIATKEGQAIRFEESDVRGMGRTAAGVHGIRLHDKDEVIGMDVVDPKNKDIQFLTIGENGLGKLTTVDNYKIQGRGGSGIKTAKVTEKTGFVIHASAVDTNKAKELDLILISANGQTIRLPFSSIPSSGRDTQGVRLMRFKDGEDKVVSVTVI